MLQQLSDYLAYEILGLDPASASGTTVNFFIYDSIKILLLLYAMIGAIAVIRTYIPQRKIKGWLAGKKLAGYIAAAVFGAVTPFCTCSSIPIFMSLIRAGIPLGPAFTFLVTSPLINEYLAVLMVSFFGLKITALYITSGMLLGIFAGLLINRLHVESQIVDDFKLAAEAGQEEEYRHFNERIGYGLSEASSIVRRLWLWVLLGVGVGALIHGFIPEELIHSVLSRTGVLSVPLATLIGVPLYASCSAVVPIAVALFQKGVPLGTALAFMMATSALSLPEAIILRRVMKIRLILLFFVIVTAGIILTGYFFNIIA